MLRLDEHAEGERLAGSSKPFVELFERGDVSVELFAPRGKDTQSPHDRDEMYLGKNPDGYCGLGGYGVKYTA
jgi:hypothetical protein